MKKSKLALLFLLFFVSSCSNNQTPESSEKHSTLTSIESIEEISKDTTIEASEVVESNLSSFASESENIDVSYPLAEDYRFISLFSKVYCNLEGYYVDLKFYNKDFEVTTDKFDFYFKDGIDAKIYYYDEEKVLVEEIFNDDVVIGYSLTFKVATVEDYLKKEKETIRFIYDDKAYDYNFYVYKIKTANVYISFDLNIYNFEFLGIYAYVDNYGPNFTDFMNKYYKNVIPGEVYELTYYGEIYIQETYPSSVSTILINIDLISKAKVIEATLSNGELVIEGYTNLENIFTYVYDENGNFVDFDDLEDGKKLYVLKIDDDSSLVVNGIFTYNPYE